MLRSKIITDLKDYVANTILDGKDIGLDEKTPLLEWGVINSLEIVRLQSYIQTQFQVKIPGNMIAADNFETLAAIADMILNIAQTSLVEHHASKTD